MKKTIFALLILIIFMTGCSGRTGPINQNYDDIPEEPVANEPVKVQEPMPSSFPKDIGTYTLEEESKKPTKCDTYEKGMTDVEGNVMDIEGQVCTRGTTLRYVDESTDRVVFVHLTQFTEGKDIQQKLFLEIYPQNYPGMIKEIEVENVYTIEKAELFWFTDLEGLDQVLTQEGEREVRADGTSYRYPYTASIDHDVTSYFLKKYPASSTKWN